MKCKTVKTALLLCLGILLAAAGGCSESPMDAPDMSAYENNGASSQDTSESAREEKEAADKHAFTPRTTILGTGSRPDPLPTVEETLENGLREAGASPVHLAVTGTPNADSVRCKWRGIARTTAQREDAVRLWLDLEDSDAIPPAEYLEVLFRATVNAAELENSETLKSNFAATTHGGLSEEYLFLTCFIDYTVSEYILGNGPDSITMVYDHRGEAPSYELYARAHDAGRLRRRGPPHPSRARRVHGNHSGKGRNRTERSGREPDNQ